VPGSIVDVREACGAHERPHRHGREMVRQMRVAREFMGGRNEGAQGATLLGAAVRGADGMAHRIPREVARTPMPLVLDQGASSLQELDPKRFRHRNSPFGLLPAGFVSAVVKLARRA
jgi:hypothetical protein